QTGEEVARKGRGRGLTAALRHAAHHVERRAYDCEPDDVTEERGFEAQPGDDHPGQRWAKQGRAMPDRRIECHGLRQVIATDEVGQDGRTRWLVERVHESAEEADDGDLPDL